MRPGPGPKRRGLRSESAAAAEEAEEAAEAAAAAEATAAAEAAEAAVGATCARLSDRLRCRTAVVRTAGTGGQALEPRFPS